MVNNVFMHNIEGNNRCYSLFLYKMHKKINKNLLKKIVLNKLTKVQIRDKLSLTLNLAEVGKFKERKRYI